MSTDHELLSRVRTWLRADDQESAGRILERVVSQLGETPQVRSTRGRLQMIAHRSSSFGSLPLLAAGVAVLAIGFVLGTLRPGLLQGLVGASPPAAGRTADPATGRYETTVGNLHLSIPQRVSWGAWDFKIPHANYFARSTGGSQGAEAVFAWVYDFNVEPCYYLNQKSRSVRWFDPAGLVAAMAEAPGIEVLSAPTPTTVDGRAATSLVVRVIDDVGCDPGFFYAWPWWLGGEFWDESYPGDTIRIWVVNIDGAPLILIAASHATADPSVEADFEEMVGGLEITSVR